MNMKKILWINILSHKEKSVYFAKKTDDVRAMNKIEVDLSPEKIDFINGTYQKELQSVLTKNEGKN